jgi:hypothetical protein
MSEQPSDEIKVRARLAQELAGGDFGTVSVITRELLEERPDLVEEQKERYDTVIVEPLQSPDI